jgi:branched-chain amino acid transport system ATP-binding protein
VLEVNNISLRFGRVAALSDVTLEVHEGELLAVIGPNGAGKTSLINCVNGFYRPAKGEIYFNNIPIGMLSRDSIAKLRIARTFQNINLYTHLSTLDNLLAGRHIHMRTGLLAGAVFFGKARREEIEHRKAVEQVIDLLDMQAIRNTPVEYLPYGLRKKVELGRALAMEPKLLLLDEPMAGMNLEEREDMVRYVFDVRELWNTTMILVEHDMEVVMDIADRVSVLDFGRKIFEGSPSEVVADSGVIAAYLGEVQIEF